MISFILAGIMNLALMFVVMSTFAFITIGITYTTTACIRKFMRFVRQPDLAIK